MSIEGQDPDWGCMIPICCATNVPSDVRDRFIARNIDYWDAPSPCRMVFVDDLSKTYREESEIGEGPALSEAPFRDKSPRECCQMLRAMRLETKSDISCPSFVIMDDRSLRDDTVLLVGESSEDDKLDHVRADFEVAYKRLRYYEDDELFDETVAKDQAAVKATEDGVLRADALLARRHGWP